MAPKVTVFVGPGVPNPLKVLIMLEELGVEYTTIAKVRLSPTLNLGVHHADGDAAPSMG